ncbi:MAG: hypothetical protein HY518_03430 [Candidatus Aenigmarchaeota archaeon]|nr:hypothetical protein [Candidatus Aenigmarchaeota archaeon]
MRAQSNMMEYVLMTFFIVIVLIAIIFFLTFFQVFQAGGEQQKALFNRQLFIAKYFLASPLFAEENSVLDDARLTALSEGDGCEELKGILGIDWSAEITVLDDSRRITCTGFNYPDCNYWSYCLQNSIGDNIAGRHSARNQSIVLPVSVFRPAGERTDIGVLKVSVYPPR